MEYIGRYQSPLGPMLLAGDAAGLAGAWFEGQKYFARSLRRVHEEREIPLFAQTRAWLDAYFSGEQPENTLPLHLMGTPFQREVWEMLRTIPHGETVTYGALVPKVAANRGVSHMSAQAVDGAVGRNPISVIVPCHRVVGAKGSLVGYAGGMDRKGALLRLEGVALQAPRQVRPGP